jgi:26S proteasome regulatory subunit N3
MDHAAMPTSKSPPAEPAPEVEIYLRLPILHHFHTSQSTYAKSMEFAHETVNKIQSLNRRSIDPLAAKIWFAVEWTYELVGELADARPLVSFNLPCRSSTHVFLKSSGSS